MNLFSSNDKPLSEQSDDEIRKSIREVQLKQLERLRERSRLGAVLKPSEWAALERLEVKLFGQGPEPDQGDSANSHILSTIEAVADHYGKSPRTVKRWIARGLPVLPGHRYDVSQIDAWLTNGQGEKEPDHTKEKDFLVKGKSYEDARRLLKNRDWEDAACEFFDLHGDRVTALLKKPQVRKCIRALVDALCEHGSLSGFQAVSIFEQTWGEPLPEKAKPAEEHPIGLQPKTTQDTIEAAARILKIALEILRSCREDDDSIERVCRAVLQSLFITEEVLACLKRGASSGGCPAA